MKDDGWGTRAKTRVTRSFGELICHGVNELGSSFATLGSVAPPVKTTSGDVVPQ